MDRRIEEQIVPSAIVEEIEEEGPVGA